MTPAILKAALDLEQSAAAFAQKRFTVGFDGFVDEILHAVDTRASRDEYVRIQTITEFSDRVRSASGKSANIEVVPMQVKLGGNGPLMSLAVAGMGGKVTCIGLLGHPHVLPVFKPLQDKAELVSVGNPGRTDALEFRDGKLMIGKLDTIQDMNWKRLREVIGPDRLRALILQADLVACTNWTMLTEMDEILENLVGLLPEKSEVTFFFDLADPEKRSREDLAGVLRRIQALNARARCILGLNLREAEQVSEVLDLREMPVEEAASVEAASARIAGALGIHGVVVHAVRCAGTSLGGETAGIEGPYCANPRLSTGAGDHFNGGFVSGVMSGLGPREALYSGVGTSGWYVRNARSPERKDVIEFLKAWGSGDLPE
jgi:sugar/nucleoside kinase (ribokinase family)